eukprot:19096-Eustigmatos_ZCMA.PRE.1
MAISAAAGAKHSACCRRVGSVMRSPTIRNSERVKIVTAVMPMMTSQISRALMLHPLQQRP